METSMKVLFIASGNSKDFEVSPFIKTQSGSLINSGFDFQWFVINEKGFLGYLKCAFKLRTYLKKNSVDIIHAHYILSGWAAILAFPKQPIVLSLMGSDAYGDYIGYKKIRLSSRYLVFLTYLIQPFVKSIICKSRHIASFVYLKRKTFIIPNGIQLEKFKCFKNDFKKELGLSPLKKHVLFLGDKNNRRKNYTLVVNAMNRINSNDISVVSPFPVTHELVVKYLNSVEVLVVPSFMEGSSNVVKEAMACNCPLVATDVGDVRWLFGDEPGHFIAGFSTNDFAKKIESALKYAEQFGRTKGRERIIALGLDSDTVAQRIVEVYEMVIGNRQSVISNNERKTLNAKRETYFEND